jgi:hypothetical protein
MATGAAAVQDFCVLALPALDISFPVSFAVVSAEVR